VREQGGNTRIAGEARAQLVTDLRARYEQGVGIRALAESTGLSYGCVRDALKAAGGHPASTGAPEVGEQHPLSRRSRIDEAGRPSPRGFGGRFGDEADVEGCEFAVVQGHPPQVARGPARPMVTSYVTHRPAVSLRTPAQGVVPGGMGKVCAGVR